MKNKLKAIAAIAAMTIAAIPLAANAAYADYVTDAYVVDGGRVVIDFANDGDINLFDTYSELADVPAPYVLSGRLYTNYYCEQKALYRGKVFTDVSVEVDVTTVGPLKGKIDGGIYIGASNASNNMDGITAYNVNVEHTAGTSDYVVKLHRFENGRWMGVQTETGKFTYTSDTVHIKAVVKDGMLYAFLNGGAQPIFSYNVGSSARGMVGIRNFYAPCYYDNFTVTGDALDVDFADLEGRITLAENRAKDELAQESKAELDAAIAQGKAAKTQAQADAAQKALASALENAVTAHTIGELTALIATADGIEREGEKNYTVNSYNSMVAVRNICATLTEDSGEYKISYWYAQLDKRIKRLIAY